MHRQLSIKANNPSEFFNSLVKFIASFYDLSITLDMQLIAALAMIAGEDGSVTISAKGRKELLAALNVKNSHLSNSFARLREKGLLTGEQGKYQLSPIMVWKKLDEAIANDDLRLTIKFVKQ